MKKEIRKRVRVVCTQSDDPSLIVGSVVRGKFLKRKQGRLVKTRNPKGAVLFVVRKDGVKCTYPATFFKLKPVIQ